MFSDDACRQHLIHYLLLLPATDLDHVSRYAFFSSGGESGRGQREVQVLYSEPGGREIYLFTDNKLIRIVKPGQG